jgi:hypothetical protein
VVVIRRCAQDATQDAPRVCGSQLLQVLAPRAKPVKLLVVWPPLGCKEQVPDTRGPVREIAPGVLVRLAWICIPDRPINLRRRQPFAG